MCSEEANAKFPRGARGERVVREFGHDLSWEINISGSEWIR